MRLEDAVKESLNAIGVTALSSQNVLCFDHVLLLGLTCKLIACLREFAYRLHKIIHLSIDYRNRQ